MSRSQIYMMVMRLIPMVAMAVDALVENKVKKRQIAPLIVETVEAALMVLIEEVSADDGEIN